MLLFSLSLFFNILLTNYKSRREQKNQSEEREIPRLFSWGKRNESIIDRNLGENEGEGGINVQKGGRGDGW
jgi:hypothetical protein